MTISVHVPDVELVQVILEKIWHLRRVVQQVRDVEIANIDLRDV